MSPEEQAAVATLRAPEAIRERCGAIYERARAGGLAHFEVEESRIGVVAGRVAEVTRRAYPELNVPGHSRWNHFRAGGLDRVPALALDGAEQVELVVLSVLLDAGAGDAWRYVEKESGQTFSRSEGLAVASLRMFERGLLSGDAGRLESTTAEALAEGFQVSADNPLVGLEGRAALLRGLGAALREAPALFGDPPRLGRLFDHLAGRAEGGALEAKAILSAVLEGFSPIWPGRVTIGGAGLGDVWPHPAAGGEGPSAGLVPFHKLSQWLSYSLFDPLERAGVRVTEKDQLTGLAEYRNGGLFVDLGVLRPRHPEVTGRAHPPGSEVIVEWRALTIALLDRVAGPVREALGVDKESYPLAKVLEGGTWSAGRQVARELREGGGPPIRIQSDGTVF